MFENGEGRRAGCHFPSFLWEKAWHSHHPYKKMPTSVLPPCSWKQELPIAGTKASACFLKQITLFHPRVSLYNIKLSSFHQGYPGLPGTLPPFQKSGFIVIYSKLREGGAKLGSLCCSLISWCATSFSQLLCTSLRSWIPALAWDVGPVCVFGCMREQENKGTGLPEGEVCVACEETSSLSASPPGTVGALLAALPWISTSQTGTSCPEKGGRCSRALCASSFKVRGC